MDTGAPRSPQGAGVRQRWWSWSCPGRPRTDVLHGLSEPPTRRRASTSGGRLQSGIGRTGRGGRAHSWVRDHVAWLFRVRSPVGLFVPAGAGRAGRLSDSRPAPAGGGRHEAAPGSAPYTRCPGAAPPVYPGEVGNRRHNARHGVTAALGCWVPPASRTPSPGCPGRPASSVPWCRPGRRAGPAAATPGRRGHAPARSAEA